jgi:hypothetical protein
MVIANRVVEAHVDMTVTSQPDELRRGAMPTSGVLQHKGFPT